MGSDESHFNVSVGSDGQSHKTVCTNHNLFEEKGEPKRYRTQVLPLNALPLGQTGSHISARTHAQTHERTHTNSLSLSLRQCKSYACVGA